MILEYIKIVFYFSSFILSLIAFLFTLKFNDWNIKNRLYDLAKQDKNSYINTIQLHVKNKPKTKFCLIRRIDIYNRKNEEKEYTHFHIKRIKALKSDVDLTHKNVLLIENNKWNKRIYKVLSKQKKSKILTHAFIDGSFLSEITYDVVVDRELEQIYLIQQSRWNKK